MKINLNDNGLHLKLAPLTLLKPAALLQMGLMSFEERWKMFFPEDEFGYETEVYLQEKYPKFSSSDLTINMNYVANEELVAALFNLPENSSLCMENKEVIGHKGNGKEKLIYTGENPIEIKERWDLFLKNEIVIKSDFELKTAGQISQQPSSTVTVIGDQSLLFIEDGAKAEACVLNTTDGPIFLAKNSEIMEGSLVRGPFSLGEKSTLKMGSKIYGGTSIAKHCKVGGEVGNSVFQSYSNKGHDGYVGNSLIGEWCNLGADTNTSNLKNNYGTIRTYSYLKKAEIQTDQQFMGLTFGDHSKCGINTMFNTATVVGVSSNIYGGDFPRKFIDSFLWGGAEFVDYKLEKAFESANNMMIRRGLELTEQDKAIFKFIFDNK
ncbi:MAG: UDP-N-acetylglucosamine diphosphorylase/glucosamine-1-phosphate N-acetyltransferase [Psychromonas sp.]|jgi:UDP-N-acetylglucosamine diphosphorylase/glucosamine-1-phosphate N-acetyltransferase